MSFGVEIRDLTVRYGRTAALEGASLTLAPGAIHGLLGRNGSGKTTLLSVLAAFRRPSAGQVLVDGEDPWENPRVMAGTCLVRESGDVEVDTAMRDTLEYLEGARPHFDRDLAERLMDTFELDPRRKPTKLSRGKRSAFGAVVGLATRAELTLFDEVYLGMDAPSRYAFYDALLEDYVEHPRTIVLSSHLIEEIERLLEHVVILDRGGVLLAEDADVLGSRGARVTGPGPAVDAFVAGRRVLRREHLGPTVQATVDDTLDETARAEASAAGLEVGPVDLQSLVVHLTAKEPVR
ncbi:ATP-binding cassette domain-containing protein [Actinotalea sp. C106]|uniref:ATP-binding cassette domain-containing protein n=1 Tax=Actinotalea sp. C106 TaxID=2908644 RepID=UPI0020279305|nr:ABC transporter ATP-binding protein [Actinotalea sp. C106]